MVIYGQSTTDTTTTTKTTDYTTRPMYMYIIYKAKDPLT